jgi:hypothetical protein
MFGHLFSGRIWRTCCIGKGAEINDTILLTDPYAHSNCRLRLRRAAAWG